MSELDFTVVVDNLTYFVVGRYPHGPLGGIALTLYLALAAGVLAFVGGLALALASLAPRRAFRWPAEAIIQVLRGVPLLMVIFWMYFGIPALLGRPVPEASTVIAALALFTSAYMSQIVRAGIESITKGQVEAARSSGMRPAQVTAFVILPQALRNMIPSFVNQFVSLIKDTSLAFIVGVSELTHIATQVNNRSLIYPTEIFLFVAGVYFILCYALTSLSRRLERRLAWRT